MWCAIRRRGSCADRPLERLQRSGDVIGRIDGLAHVVQERRQQELLVIGPLGPRQLEDLQAVIERIPLGMIAGTLLDGFERLEQEPVELEAVDVVLEPFDLLFQVRLRVLGTEPVLELGDRGPLDRLAGDRALEHVVHLVLGIEGQLVAVAVGDVDMGEDPLFAELHDPLALDGVVEAMLLQRGRDEREAIAEDVDVDVGAVADVPGPDAADQPGPVPRQLAHQPQGLDPHVAEVLEALRPFVHPGHGLDLVADLAVARQVGGTIAVLDPKLARGLALGGEVLGFAALVHQLGGKKGDLPPEACVGHEWCAPIVPIKAAPGFAVGRLRSAASGGPPRSEGEGEKRYILILTRPRRGGQAEGALALQRRCLPAPPPLRRGGREVAATTASVSNRSHTHLISRVRRWRYRHPLPSELDVKVSLHPAQAFITAPCGTRPLLSVLLARGSADDSWRVVTPCCPPSWNRHGFPDAMMDLAVIRSYP